MIQETNISFRKKIVLGTVQFGLDYGINNSSGKPGEKMVKLILDTAFIHGVRLLDTAEAYGDSQEVIGNYHRQSTNRFRVITKFSRQNHKGDLVQQVSTDMEKLGVENLYCYMFHSFNDYIEYYDRFSPEIRILKSKGIITKFGVSVYTNSELENLIGKENIDLVQLPFNLLDNMAQRGELIKQAHRSGIEIHTRSVFLQGLFFKDFDKLTPGLRQLENELVQIKQLAKKNKIGLQALALQYALSQSTIDGVLVGVETVDQLNENIKALEEKVAVEVFKEVDTIDVKMNELLNPSKWSS